MIKRLALVTAALATLQGCSSMMAVGEPEFSCSGMPTNAKCISTTEAYKQSEGGAIPNPANQPPVADTSGQASGQLQPLTRAYATQAGDPVVETFVTPQLPDDPVPVRTPSQVMRIWMSSWEDSESGALIAPGYVYTEITPRKWVIGKTERAADGDSTVFKPLAVPSTQR